MLNLCRAVYTLKLCSHRMQSQYSPRVTHTSFTAGSFVFIWPNSLNTNCTLSVSQLATDTPLYLWECSSVCLCLVQPLTELRTQQEVWFFLLFPSSFSPFSLSSLYVYEVFSLFRKTERDSVDQREEPPLSLM